MSFARNLKAIMQEQSLTQTDLSALTGIGKSSLSQYLSGKNTPHRGRIAEIASALGVSHGRLTADMQENPEASFVVSGQKITIEETARRLGKSPQFVRMALQNGAAPFGFATKVTGNHFDYHISPKLLDEYIGGKVGFSKEMPCATCH